MGGGVDGIDPGDLQLLPDFLQDALIYWGWADPPPPPPLPPLQPWNKNVYTVMGGIPDPKAVVDRVRAGIEADAQFQKWQEKESARQEKEMAEEVERRQDELDEARAARDQLRAIREDAGLAMRYQLEYYDENGYGTDAWGAFRDRERAADARLAAAEQGLTHAQAVQDARSKPTGLTAGQSQALNDFLEHPNRWGETDGILQTEGMKVKILVADAPFEGETGKVSTTTGSERSGSDTASSKTTNTQGQTATSGEKGSLDMKGPAIEATRGNEINVGVGNEEGSSRTTGRVDKDSTTVEHTNAETKPREVWAEVTTASGTIKVNLGELPVSRPK